MFGWGKFRHPRILVPHVQLRCTIAGTTILGIHCGSEKKKYFGIRTRISTDPDMQYTGTRTSLQKRNVSCRPTEQEMARIAQKVSGGKFCHPKFSPAEITPPPPCRGSVVLTETHRTRYAPPAPPNTPLSVRAPSSPRNPQTYT